MKSTLGGRFVAAVAGSAIIMGVGAAQGLGGAIARRFAKGGLPVIITGRTQEKLDAVADAVAQNTFIAKLGTGILATVWAAAVGAIMYIFGDS